MCFHSYFQQMMNHISCPSTQAPTQKLFGFITYLSTLENSPVQREGLEWVCVSSLQRHCVAFLGDGERGVPNYDSDGSEFLLSASSNRQCGTQDSQFFETKLILFFFEAQTVKVIIRSTEDKGERRQLEKTREYHQEVLAAEGVECPQGKASAKASEASCWSRLSLKSREGDSGLPCREEHTPWASCFLTPDSKFQLLLLYRLFLEI